MTDTVWAALIGVGGAVLVAIATVVTQLFVTRSVIHAEQARVGQQLLGEARSRYSERLEDRLLEAVSELLAVADPQVEPGPSYSKAVVLIHRIQLLLDPAISVDGALNAAVNQLGQSLQEYHFVRARHIDKKLAETRNLLEAQGSVAECAKAVIRRHDVAAT